MTENRRSTDAFDIGVLKTAKARSKMCVIFAINCHTLLISVQNFNDRIPCLPERALHISQCTAIHLRSTSSESPEIAINRAAMSEMLHLEPALGSTDSLVKSDRSVMLSGNSCFEL